MDTAEFLQEQNMDLNAACEKLKDENKQLLKALVIAEMALGIMHSKRHLMNIRPTEAKEQAREELKRQAKLAGVGSLEPRQVENRNT